ncbi:GntP family permease [Brachyspira pilosicoli]|uniref:GntP family permease n=1 Tax=Brachyspira pilosicoli TaxID=52584 RepID=A0AAJ6KBR0_BRAPL|nr:GntP family permease [Brachyspira pilosicoli]MBW5377626.1 GntP family permease [Brachyspira pilosicoli]MBW5382994.1 GntP family permease [Brachyspira pilosicoli]MBW5399461.1 GntP family permease [Brachyspira pilosicoli]PLV58115.1 GntP protein [Brachyspira pilosicoli SP16]WIH85774.1 GntP family permease [Brachyspira pilosicoli]
MSGGLLIIVFVICIAVMIFAISKLKIHPFLSIMGISVIFAFIADISLKDIPSIIGAGFSGTFTSIGIVIILGALIGTVLEKTGGALKLSDMVIKVVGKKNPELAMLIMGWIVSIPVFCDSGFVILNPIKKALIKRTMTSTVAMSMALSAGLYISHVFIPPTPGPIAAANSLNVGNHLLIVIGMGVACSILPLIAGYFFAKYIGTKVKSSSELNNTDETVQTYEELVASYGKLPNGFLAVSPIIVPILLMALASIFNMAKIEGNISILVNFLGTPIIALAVGVIFSVITYFNQKKHTKEMQSFYDMTNDTLKIVGPILFVTAAGGVLGKVISSSSLVAFITENATIFESIGIFFPFILSAILKTAQGSSTVALTTTAGILAPLMGALGLDTPVLASLTVMAIGAGAMTVSHANDSYYWVVTNFSDIKAQDGYKTQTLMTLVIGIFGMINVFLLSLFF